MADITILIKKMFTTGLTGTERILLSEKKRMKAVLTQQWEESQEQHLKDKVDPEKMWTNIASACFGEPKKKAVRSLTVAYGVAAVAILLLLGVWMARSYSDSYVTVTTPKGAEMLVVTLPDSSKIWLNAGSSIRYPKSFHNNRNVDLVGEAFFDVTKIPSSPFRVSFDGASVEVKGTEFNVRSDSRSAEVTLFSGKIVFCTPESGVLEMKPLDRVVYNVMDRQIKHFKVDTVEYDWRSTEYRFSDKPLKELVEFLNRTYGVEIMVKDEAFEKMLFTGSIRKQETLHDVLDKVCISFDLHKRIEKDLIILY